ncbi:hypothetical protein [Actinokineospora sp.]|uniref:hypothetical protein n=1 Tax=Actinokineospora sp. TaxID=1872133 RepID=UPI004037EFEF
MSELASEPSKQGELASEPTTQGEPASEPSTGAETERVLVTVDDAGLARLTELVADLRDAGLLVEEVLEPIGTITGSVAVDSLAALSEVSGVDGVEPQLASFQIPEPDSDVQ